MAVKVLMAVCMLPILPIMYGVMWFSSREKNGILYGVTLWEGAREDLQVQKIRKSYKRNLNFWALICLFLFLLTLLTDYESIMISGQVLWIFLTIICLFLPFAWAHKAKVFPEGPVSGLHFWNHACLGGIIFIPRLAPSADAWPVGA